MPSSTRAPRRRWRALAISSTTSALLLAGVVATPVGATPPADAPVGAPTRDASGVPADVLDDETVVVTDAGLLIDEPEPFDGWPDELIDQVIAASNVAGSDRPADAAEAPTAAAAFTLHSRPNASLTIYLDFTGHTTAGTAWNGDPNSSSSNGRPASFTSVPYSRDADPAFNPTELLYIGEIWEHVAEDYAPFNVDVTTEEPTFDELWRSSAADTTYGTHVVISPTQDWYGSSGGVAYIGSFSWSNVRTPSPELAPVVTPAFVFSGALGGGWPKYVAEAAADEAGHTLNLYHDGKDTSGYYGGHAVVGGGGWAPIMGVGYSQNITQWSAGAYPGATQTQDDLSILASRLGWASAGSSVVGPATLVDGENLVGTVERSDVPVDIEIVVATGNTSVAIVPAVADTNLLVSAQLRTGSTVIATASPAGATGWRLDFDEPLTAGTYTVRLTSIGWGDVTATVLDGLPAYGSVGQFRISLDVVETAVPSTVSPTTSSTSAPPTTPTTSPPQPTTTSPRTTTPTTPTTPTTVAPRPRDPAKSDQPAGCAATARGGVVGFGEQRAATPCFAPATRLG